MLNLPLNCWPRIADPGLTCTCGQFKVSGVHFLEARRRWWEHAMEQSERENERT